VYRDFTRVGASKVPDAKTMGRWGTALGPQVLKQIHERIVKIALEKGVVTGRRMRVDTTVVETNIHYPTDSTLLGDGVRVLTRAMKKITKIAGAVGTKLCDRSRSVKFRLLEIGRVARAKARGAINRDKLKRCYGQLLNTTSRVVGQAKRFAAEIVQGVKQATTPMKQLALEGLRHELDEMVPLVRQVMKQTRARIFHGNTRSEGKLVSLFEPSTEIIRKGKASKPTEFGKMVKLQEAENQIITAYEVYPERPYDSDLLIPAIDTHQALLGRVPRLVAADALARPRAGHSASAPARQSRHGRALRDGEARLDAGCGSLHADVASRLTMRSRSRKSVRTLWRISIEPRGPSITRAFAWPQFWPPLNSAAVALASAVKRPVPAAAMTRDISTRGKLGTIAVTALPNAKAAKAVTSVVRRDQRR
jgi:IS5 family transposase